MNTYTGNCHCGAVTYNVEAEFEQAITCNCSHCLRKGMMLAFVPESQFTLLTGEENLTLYQFNKKQIDHLFCKTCGVQSFSRGHDGSGNIMIAINLNCLEDFDTSGLTITPYDGKSV